MADRFFSTTTADKVYALDTAWAYSKANEKPLPASFRALESDARSFVAAGALKASATNGHSSMAFDPGTGAPAPVEDARMWRDLLDLYQRAILWILNPSMGLDGTIPTSFDYIARDDSATPYATITVALPMASLVDDTTVDGLMRNWLVPITEIQNEYTQLRVPAWGRNTQ